MIDRKDGKLVSRDETGEIVPINKKDVEDAFDIKVDDIEKKLGKQPEEEQDLPAKPKPKVKPKVKKRSASSRIKEAFFGTDVVSVKDYVIYDVIIPYVKNLIVEAINSATRMTFLGDARPIKFSRQTGPTHTSMAREYEERNGRTRSRSNTIENRIRDVIFEDEESADAALDYLIEHIQENDDVTLQDFFIYVGAPVLSTDNRWGWTNLSSARIVEMVGEGYFLDLPRVRPID